MSAQKRTSESSASALLTNDENLVVRQFLGQRCPSLATTVVQIYKSEGPSHNRWNKRTCGVVCFVKDNPKRSYFIRVIDMDRRMVVFDQEIYNQFRYKTPRPYFHTFEAEDGQVGLNFADETEAAHFQHVVEDKLAERRQRRERRAAVKRHSLGGSSSNANGAQKGDAPPPPSSTGIAMINGGGFVAPVSVVAPSPLITPAHQPARHHYFSQRSKKGEKRKLKKEDISLPTNFQHISHVGWDPNRGFDLENVDPKLKQFFSRAGVSERELQDKETRDFIYEFIERHGGIDAALMEEDRRTSITPPPTNIMTTMTYQPSAPAPPPPPRHSSIARPPPPSKVQASPHKPTPEPPQPPSQPRQQPQQQSPGRPQMPPTTATTTAPPPPPPPPPPILAASSAKSTAPMPPQAAPPAPPAPPPPPPPAPSAPPSAPPPPPSLPPVDDFRSNLMEQIRQGSGTLRHVGEVKKARPAIDTRGVLLDQIRSGVTLKKVDPEALSRGGDEDAAVSAGIAGMLQKALQERTAALCLSSSEDEEAEDDEDEWDE